MSEKIFLHSPVGNSDPKYDFVRAPYRDISTNSPMYLKKMRLDDWTVEPWLFGAPEFYIIVSDVDPITHETRLVQQLDYSFEHRSMTSDQLDDKLILNWIPGFWYEFMTFNIVEYDRFNGTLDLNLVAEFGTKDLTLPIPGLTITGGIEYQHTISHDGTDCGKQFIGYYDYPEGWINFPNFGVGILINEDDSPCYTERVIKP